MKYATIAAAVLASAAMAQPHGHHRRHQHHHDKRELVVEWTTEIETITVVLDETGAETIYPSKTAAAVATPSSSGSPGEFFQAPSSSSSSSSASIASSTSVVVVPSPSPSPSSSSTTQQAPSPQPTTSTSSTPVVVPTTTSVAPVQPTTTAAAPPASTTAASSSGGSSGSGGASKSGKMTYYQVGMGSCGYDDSGADESKNIVAMGHTFWSSISTLTSYGVNQPANPLCDQQITIKASNGNSAVGVIRDMCPGCDGEGIDVSEKLFKELMGGTDAGKVDVTWSFNSGKW